MRMKSYLEIKVPIENNAPWFEELRNRICQHGINVRWQNAYYHITVAFIYEEPKDESIRSLFFNCLKWRGAPSLTFDKLDAFTISHDRHILFLISEHPSEEFSTMVREVRETLAGTSCNFDKDFRLHVTLGRVFDERVGIDQLKNLANSIVVPPFTMRLSEAQYREYRGGVIDKWTMWPNKESAAKAEEEQTRTAFQNAFSNIGMLNQDI